MGRKAAPQPLALSDPSTQGHGHGHGHGYGRSRDDPLTAETPSSQPSMVSPAESRSPRSPRSSPFTSRFSPLRSQTGKQNQNQSQSQNQNPNTQLNQQQLHPHSQPQQQQQQQQYRQRNQQQQLQPTDDTLQPQITNDRLSYEDPSSNYPSISSALDPTLAPNSQSGPSSRKPPPGKKPSKGGFFHFSKASKSANQFQPQNMFQNIEPRSQTISRGSDATSTSRQGADSNPYSDNYSQPPISSTPSGTDLSASYADQDGISPQASSKKAKSKPFGLLSRTKSIRDKDGPSPRENSTSPVPPPPPTASGNEPELYLNSAPLRTAPVAQDRAFRDMMNSTVRNKSEDRAPARDGSHKDNHRNKEAKQPQSSLRENGSTFLSGLRSSSTRAADMISKGFFGKNSRSGSTTERESAIDDENYQLKVINLPLVEQTRITRISKRLEDSRDKTEFWMPAFPWRAIDYLNYKGCEVEGLYRVPGSGPQIKKWQRRFDEKHDVDLFEADDLYDINIVGSMLKAWLRELPDELFPKAAQERVARECAGAEKVPELLIEELSNLSPFNYYLLFAITCHLSLLLAHSDKNKMDFRNLCICFQPCMKIDAFCFKFLVCDWRECWRGCKNESKYIEEEYLLFDQPPPRGLTEPQRPVHVDSDNDRQQLSSSDSSKPSNPGSSTAENKGKLKKKQLQQSESQSGVDSNNPSVPTALTINSDRNLPPRADRPDLRPLSPIKPLSPLGF